MVRLSHIVFVAALLAAPLAYGQAGVTCCAAPDPVAYEKMRQRSEIADRLRQAHRLREECQCGELPEMTRMVMEELRAAQQPRVRH